VGGAGWRFHSYWREYLVFWRCRCPLLYWETQTWPAFMFSAVLCVSRSVPGTGIKENSPDSGTAFDVEWCYTPACDFVIQTSWFLSILVEFRSDLLRLSFFTTSNVRRTYYRIFGFFY
jgi:hypothetical protein